MWRARVPPPARRTTWMPCFRASTISSRIGNSAARPRSRMLWPPIFTTLTSGITAVGRYSKVSWPVSVDDDSSESMVRRSDILDALLHDDGADVLAAQRARELATLEAVDDDDALAVLRRLECLVELEVEDVLLRHPLRELVERDLAEQLRVGVLLRIL